LNGKKETESTSTDWFQNLSNRHQQLIISIFALERSRA